MAVLKQQNFKIVKGMSLDVDIQTSTSDTAFRLFNIKNQVLDGASSNNLTNEKGNSEIPIVDTNNGPLTIEGTILGVILCTSNMVVLFTFVAPATGHPYNNIYRVTYDLDNNKLIAKLLATGDFDIPLVHDLDGVTVNTEIHGIFSYENSEILKVYWVDGVNLLRYINIVDTSGTVISDETKLNSCPVFSLGHTLNVERVPGGGIYSPGTILFAFTYFNKYGAETNIVDYSPLYYIGEEHRGCREDETVGCSFRVTIQNPDNNFDYIRVYSIQRTSLNGTPIVKTVGDIRVKGILGDTVSLLDINGGASIDAASLLFKASSDNIYQYIEQKDGTLFLGNYKTTAATQELHLVVDTLISSGKISFSDDTTVVDIAVTSNEQYAYLPDLTQNSLQKKLFKKGEEYALGLVFIYKTGKWSSVYYVGKWSPVVEPSLENNQYTKPVRVCNITSNAAAALANIGVIGVMPVYAVKNLHSVKCLGFLSTTMHSSTRYDQEHILSNYSWFYRPLIPTTNSQLPVDSFLTLEFQNLLTGPNTGTYGSSNLWSYTQNIYILNTPEVECNELLSESLLAGCQCDNIGVYLGFTYINNLTLLVTGKYLLSSFSISSLDHSYGFGTGRNHTPTPVTSISDKRVISGYFWYGFVDRGYEENNRITESGRESNTSNTRNYSWYLVYPWQRDKIGGEGANSKIQSKILYNHLYSNCLTVVSGINYPSVYSALIYRDFDTSSLLRVNEQIVYLGNTDYIEATDANHAYYALATPTNLSEDNSGLWPKANENNSPYAGYDKDGKIIDPISLKYKASPHIVIAFNENLEFHGDSSKEYLFCALLRNPSEQLPDGQQDLKGYQWIKCGSLLKIQTTEATTLTYEEGDYFYGRYDSLRTYQYAENDPNSVIEVVSGMLCSRINLDARCDRNRGSRTATISPENFNLFNPVYDLLNNYFTFTYVDMSDVIYLRHYKNSILWSLTKEFSSDIDNWCNIQDINTLDLDGDKGLIRALTKLGNDIIVFQDTGIAQVLYNEKTQIATTEGVPIEISNSGKVDGKYYLYDSIGCLYSGSVSKTPNGIFFVDGINKSLFLLQLDKLISDLCTVLGMRSWGLANLDSKWWSYYDINSLEVLFTKDVESIAYNVPYGKFSTFLAYGRVRWNFRMDNTTFQICPPNFEQVISSTTNTLYDIKRRVSKTVQHDNTSNTFWKKNSIDAPKFFGNYSPIEVQLQCNPEPTIDKIFSVLEYRMDCFDENNNYLPDSTFTMFRAWNEYQDTLLTSLLYNEGVREGVVYTTKYTARLKKKFRIWRLDIPRAKYGSTIFVSGNEADIPDLSNTEETEISLGTSTGGGSRDRIRNPWCNIYLALNIKETDIVKPSKIILNDLAIQYFK